MYKLHTDKAELFECEVAVKNASTKNSIARLIVESKDAVDLVFEGKIEGEKCTIPIRKLKGILDEEETGKMHLEVIVEDTYFRPWTSDFIVEAYTSVKVKVDEEPTIINKPMVEVRMPTKKKEVLAAAKKIRKIHPKPVQSGKTKSDVLVAMSEISVLCQSFDISRSNITKKRAEFSQILKEYFRSNPDYQEHKIQILKEVNSFLKE